jgi:hypothetical protein
LHHRVQEQAVKRVQAAGLVVAAKHQGPVERTLRDWATGQLGKGREGPRADGTGLQAGES